MKAFARGAAILACMVAASSLYAQSQSCTNATLSGGYGYLSQGNLIEQESLLPYADMGNLTADGNGNFSGTGSQSFGGTIEQGTSITGTYVINSDCTGTASLTYSNIGAFHFNLVVVNNGQTINMVQTDQGSMVSGTAEQQQETNCVLESLNGSYSFTITGSFIDSSGNTDPYVDSGEMTFNGSGGVSIIDTISEVGQVSPNRSYTGVYATHSNCTGTLTLSDPTLGTLHMNLAIVDAGRGIRYVDLDPDIIFSGFANTLADVAAGGTMAQVASGGGWLTTFTLSNTGTSPANIQLNFYGDNGDPVSLPLLFVDSGNQTTASSVSETIAVGATLVIATNATSTAALVTGSAELASEGGTVGGFAVFHYNPNAQEAVVPIQTQNAAAYILAFDDTNGLSTGLAVANVSSQAVKIPLILRNDSGNQLGTSTLDLAAHGHTSFTLTSAYGFAQNQRGTVELDTPTGAQISALAIRGAPTGAFTTIPLLLK